MFSQPLLPEALTLLKHEHEYLESLLVQCEINIRNREMTYLQSLLELFRAVHTHGQLEEELVYPLAHRHIYKSNDLLLLEFEEVHTDLSELIDQRHGLEQTDATVSFLLEELFENMRLHIEEEATLFHDLLRLAPAQLKQLAQDLQQQRYHRLAPDTAN